MQLQYAIATKVTLYYLVATYYVNTNMPCKITGTVSILHTLNCADIIDHINHIIIIIVLNYNMH